VVDGASLVRFEDESLLNVQPVAKPYSKNKVNSLGFFGGAFPW